MIGGLSTSKAVSRTGKERAGFRDRDSLRVAGRFLLFAISANLGLWFLGQSGYVSLFYLSFFERFTAQVAEIGRAHV